jgi:hypothetical protein
MLLYKRLVILCGWMIFAMHFPSMSEADGFCMNLISKVWPSIQSNSFSDPLAESITHALQRPDFLKSMKPSDRSWLMSLLSQIEPEVTTTLEARLESLVDSLESTGDEIFIRWAERQFKAVQSTPGLWAAFAPTRSDQLDQSQQWDRPETEDQWTEMEDRFVQHNVSRVRERLSLLWPPALR